MAIEAQRLDVALPKAAAGKATGNFSVGACLSQAAACLGAGECEQALALVQSTIEVVPGNATVRLALGVVLRAMGRLDEAAEVFVSLPESAEAQVYLGMIRLAQGRQADGWALYRARWRYANWPEKLRYPENALWQGQQKAGMRLLLWGEQGFGDCLQFARYAPWLLHMLRSQGGTLALEVPAPLSALLCASWPFLEIYSMGEVRGNFDAHLPLMDLPSCWGGEVGTHGLPYLPMPIPYLSALPDLSRGQRGAVPRPISGQPLRVGIVWQGRTTHPDDRWRSIPVAHLDALFSVAGVRWVSLQKDQGPVPAWLPDDMADCQDFSDTARVVDGLDLLVSIDSAVAHLAAALGKPVWLLLAKVADWRWQLTGDLTPWYPSMRLFRQGVNEDWPQVLARVASALATLRGRAMAA